MAILRMLRGPVEIQCRRDPVDLNGYLADLTTLDPTRSQALVWYRSRRTEPLRSFLRERNSSIVDLAVEGDAWRSTTHRLDLSPEGPWLRHVGLCRMALPWTSPRLSRLQTLTLGSLAQGEVGLTLIRVSLSGSFPNQWILFDGLVSRLQAACWKPKVLHISLDVPEYRLDTETAPAVFCSFPLSFQTIEKLSLALPSSASHCSTLRLLACGIPA